MPLLRSTLGTEVNVDGIEMPRSGEFTLSTEQLAALKEHSIAKHWFETRALVELDEDGEAPLPDAPAPEGTGLVDNSQLET